VALTKTGTDGIKDNAVTSAKLATGAVTSAKIADLSITTNDIADAQITQAKIGNSAIVAAKIADDAVADNKLSDHASDDSFRAVGTNHIKTNAVTTAKIADEAVTLAKLPHGDGSSDGKFLRANNGADPSFETITGTTINNNADNRVITGSGTANTLSGESGLTYDGAKLDVTGKIESTDFISIAADNKKLKIGAGDDIQIYHNGNHSFIGNSTGDLTISNTSDDIFIDAVDDIFIRTNTNEDAIKCIGNGRLELYYDNSKKLETTSYGTKISGYQSSSGYVGFHVMGTRSNEGFGTNHGSGITTYDVDYYSPIPMFASKTIDHGSSYLSFPTYANGRYIKFTAPVAGLYQFELLAAVEAHDGGDWFAFGWEINTETSNSGSDLMNNGRGVCTNYKRAGGDEGAGCHFSTTIWMDTNDYAVLYQQSTAAVRFANNRCFVRGHLIH
tara:strand:- start:298 stop:1632 length:1335 start_codon:yes stop_codon:yes gene_type:complete